VRAGNKDVANEVSSSQDFTDSQQLKLGPLGHAVAVGIFACAKDGTLVEFNQRCIEFWGVEPAAGDAKFGEACKIYCADGHALPQADNPMAVALQTGKPVESAELIFERPNGERIAVDVGVNPIFAADGELIGAVGCIQDARKRELQAARLAAIVASSDDAIVSKSLDGYITTWNAGAERIFGYSAQEMVGQHITRIIPAELRSEEDDILARLQKGERIDHFETVRVAKDGRRIDVSVTISPIRDASGKPVGASKVGRDISDQKHFERSQQLLIDELNHRVKNTLAMVQSIANQTVQRTKNPIEFAASFSGRLHALAQTHTLLTQSIWQGADLLTMIREQLPVGPSDSRVSYSGPSVMLNAQTALHLGLVLHELATNAMKYGALSKPNGRLSIRWTVRTEGGRCLSLRWEERGGPKVSVPASRGFGSTLIEKSLEAHGGVTSIRYEAQGMTCDIKLPLSDNEESAGGSYNRLRLSSREALSAGRSTDDREVATIAGRRILVVDDEPLIAMDIVASLEEEGCKIVGPAATLQKALKLIESAEIDAALLDANLAGDPVDVLASALLRRKKPFAFVSGYGREGLPESFRQATLIKKPFQRQNLIDVVQDMVLKTDTIVPLRRST
jgi:PAS domain S-box-containing protein